MIESEYEMAAAKLGASSAPANLQEFYTVFSFYLFVRSPLTQFTWSASETNNMAGLVHLHLLDAHLDIQVNGRVLLLVLHAGSGFPLPCHCLP